MFRVAIVEDEMSPAEKLKTYIMRYGKEHSVEFSVEICSNPVDFVTDYTAQYDMIFMDIEMPLMNGMECAKKLRETDTRVPLAFITNMVQYSVKGYEVDAIGYMVKPVEYFPFSVLMDKIVKKCNLEDDKYIVVRGNNKIIRISLKELYYVEVMDHYLIYHTADGDIRTLGKIKDAELVLQNDNFFRCNNSYLVNLRFVKSIDGNDVTVANDTLQISRQKRKIFLAALNEYFVQGGGI